MVVCYGRFLSCISSRSIDVDLVLQTLVKLDKRNIG